MLVTFPQQLFVSGNFTLARFGDQDLRGYYRYDDEGVEAQDTLLVERGSLKAFMGTRVGIAPRHAPLVTQLKPGELRVDPGGGKEQEHFYVSGGMIEVQPFKVTILADTGIRAADLDEAAAQVLAWTVQNRIGFALVCASLIAMAFGRAGNREKLLGG